MKKLITITVALLMAAMSLKAQEGEIIYRDFVPDTVLRIGYQQPHEIWIDFDNDNLPDLQMFWYNESPGVVVGLSGRDTYVKICQAEEGDTISQLSEWQSGTSYPHLWEKYAIRIEKEGEYYFGWFRTYVIPTEQNLYFDKFAFCTIPNYPLMWGQTEIENYIVYRDFEPDSVLNVGYLSGSMLIDLDGEGHPDINMTFHTESPGTVFPNMTSIYPDSIMICAVEPNCVLSEAENWTAGLDYQTIWENSSYYGIRFKHNDGFLYGWFENYIQHINNHLFWGFDRTAFCLIPNYPLIWGQTDLNPIGQNGAEWYYEIEWDNGSITYQHLECVGDTLFDRAGKRPKVIVRSNTHYERDSITEMTHEYVYEENGIVYWWNRDLQEFTTLYNLAANAGDEWEIKVGTESLIMHVDAVETIEYEDKTYRMLRVSDPEDLFSGSIVCGIGHLTSFFPERLMTRDKGYRVEGMRCYWVDGELVFKIGDEDCDAVYGELHGIEENCPSTGSGTFAAYPNPANGILFVETRHGTSLPDQTYRITNFMGQTLLQGHITAETQQVDIANLPAGMYFISVGEKTVKFVKQ